MTPTERTRRRRSSSLHGDSFSVGAGSSAGGTVTTALLGLILLAGPILLGATPLWVRLPLFAAIALLLVLQGFRLSAQPRPGVARRADAIDMAAILFVLYAAVRWLTSPAEYVSRIEVMQAFACAGVFLTCRYGMANRANCMFLLYLITGLGVAEIFAGFDLGQQPEMASWGLSNGGIVPQSARWVGTYLWPNHFACLLVMTMSVAFALGGFSKLPWPARIVLVYAGLIMIIGVLWSGSRGGCLALVAAVAGLVTMGVRNGTLRWWWPVTAGTVLVGVTMGLFAFSPVGVARLAQSSKLLDGNVATEPRFELSRNALRIARDYPVFGSGPATFEYLYPRYRVRESDFYVPATHDDYLNCVDDYGLVGFALAFFFVAAVTLKFFRPLDVDHRWQERTLVAAGFAAWLSLLVYSFFDYNLHVPANALLLAALTGLAVGRFRREDDPAWSMVSLVRLGPWPGVAVIAVALAVGAEAARMGLGAITYHRALLQITEVPVDASIAAARQTLRLDPDSQDGLMFLGNLYRFRAEHDATAADKMRDGQEALAAYERALRGNTLNDVLQVRVGMGLDLVGRYAEALPHFEAALAAEPRNGRFWKALSDHYTAAGLPSEATRAYGRAARTYFGWREISDADQDLHGLPGSGEVIRPKAVVEPAQVEEAPPVIRPAPSPLPPSEPVEVLVVPTTNAPATNDEKLPSLILPDDAAQK